MPRRPRIPRVHDPLAAELPAPSPGEERIAAPAEVAALPGGGAELAPTPPTLDSIAD